MHDTVPTTWLCLSLTGWLSHDPTRDNVKSLRIRALLPNGTILLVIPGTLSGKAHVPLGRAQICVPSAEEENPFGVVKNVALRTLHSKLAAGACRLTACVFNDVDGSTVIKQYIHLPGDVCDATDANGDGWCDATGAPSDIPKRLSAVNVTPACTDSF